jgi:N-acyl-D-amino-acid deacylase
MYDIVIQGGTLVDGSGAPWYRGDVAIRDGKIVFVGAVQGAEPNRVINAQGLIVAPGFIDIHSHDDLHILENQWMDAKIRQGVTTTVIGNCGFGLYPVVPENKQLFLEYATGIFGQPEKQDMGYAELEDLFYDIEKSGTTINVASLVAHGVLRVAVMGYENRKPTEVELQKMKDLLRQALRSGAVGMSIGLIYAPGAYADTQELIELSKVVAEEGGIITSHMRNEANFLLEAIEEMLTIARVAKVPLEISHLKACGTANIGKGKEAIRRIAQAKMEGIDVTFDQYPYPAGSTTVTTLLPPWALEGGIEKMLERIRDQETRARIKEDMINGIPGSPWETQWKLIGWENVMICSVEKPENKRFEGNNVKDITEQLGVDPVDFILDLLTQEQGRIIMVTFQQDMNELEAIMVHDLQMFGSDGLPLKGKKAHPRLYGTYPKVLGTFVRENNLLSLERAIYKMTYMPANRLGLLDRGLIRPGMAADITIFNKDTVADLATYTNPAVNPSGIETVIVNGRIVLENGDLTKDLPGKPLRRQQLIEKEQKEIV